MKIKANAYYRRVSNSELRFSDHEHEADDGKWEEILVMTPGQFQQGLSAETERCATVARQEMRKCDYEFYSVEFQDRAIERVCNAIFGIKP